jgi:hypothetical protein
MTKHADEPTMGSRSRALALERPVPLDRAKRTLLQEALLEGAKVVEIVEQTVVGYGRWLLL